MRRPYQASLFGESRPREAETSSVAHERMQVKLWLLDDSGAKAVRMLVLPEPEARQVWIARSLMGDRISKHRDPGCAFWCWEFTLPLWKVEELDLPNKP